MQNAKRIMQNYLKIFNFEFCITNYASAFVTEVSKAETGAYAVPRHHLVKFRNNGASKRLNCFDS